MTPQNSPAVEQAAREIGAVLDDLEQRTDGEVRKLELDHLVDTDASGHPVVKKSVDIEVQPQPRRNWSR